jgi:dephospho-CoA kinase
MEGAPADVVAFVWDTPLLLEVGLNRLCDAVVYVEAAESDRLARVAGQRGWDAAELFRREKLQLPLDKKRKMSDHVVVNTAKVDDVRCQIRAILSRIVADLPGRPPRA